MPANSQHPDYRRMLGKWRRCRDAADGQDAVHSAGDAYLPRLSDQPEPEYQAYKQRAAWYNATWRTIAGLKGMVFRIPPQVEVPPAAEEMLKDVTLSGVPMQELAEEVVEEALKVGRIGILVDYPEADAMGITLADARAMNLRPTMALYRAEAIINWRTGRVRNATALTLLVLEECRWEPVDEFESKEKKQYRVLDLVGAEGPSPQYRVRLFEVGADGKDVQVGPDTFPMMGGKPMGYIPFVFVGIDGTRPEVDEPPLIDLVDLNLSHYRTNADYEHGAHFTGLPTPVVTGWTPEKEGEKLYIGSQTAWVLRNSDANAKYLEFSGQGLEALRNLLKDKEQQMAVLGARMLEPQKKGVETADSQSIHRKGEESMLAGAAQAVSLALETALRWFCEWAGAKDAEPKYQLNREFYPAPMASDKLSALVSAWQQGAISMQTLFENLQRGDVIARDTTLEEEQARIEAEGPKLGALGMPLPGDEDEDEDEDEDPDEEGIEPEERERRMKAAKAKGAPFGGNARA